MSKTRPTYDSQRDRENYTFHPGRQFHLEWNPDPGACYLFALDERQASLLRTMLAVFPKYYWVWAIPGPMSEWDAATQQQWVDISDFVEELEVCLLSGCDVSQLITQMTRIADALEGQQEQTITIDDALLDSIKALIETWEAGGGSSILDALRVIKDFLETLFFLKALLPAPPPRIPIAQFFQLVTDFLYRRSQMRALWTNAINGRIANLLSGGDELVDAGVEFDNFMRIMDNGGVGVGGLKANIPGLGWLFPATVNDIDIDDAIEKLFEYFKTNDPDQIQANSRGIEVLQAIAGAVKGLDLTSTINLNNYQGCGCDGDCDCEEQTITVDEDEDITETVVVV
ncbi:MAG: hypothetical protein ACE5FZ_06640 [Nitrospiria bacterium]